MGFPHLLGIKSRLSILRHDCNQRNCMASNAPIATRLILTDVAKLEEVDRDSLVMRYLEQLSTPQSVQGKAIE